MFNNEIETFYTDLELSQALNDVLFIHYDEIQNKYLDLCVEYGTIEFNEPSRFQKFQLYLLNKFKEDLYFKAFIGLALINKDTKGKLLYLLRRTDPFITFFKNDEIIFESYKYAFDLL